jgi:hypothetical protein
MSPSSQQHALTIAQVVTGIGIATFWLLFVRIGMAPASPPACYFAYEHAFPPPDLLLAAALVASGIDILRGGEWGMNVSLACGGGLTFLGVLDPQFFRPERRLCRAVERGAAGRHHLAVVHRPRAGDHRPARSA